MTDSVFDVALEKRFTESAEIATIDVTSADALLIRDSTTGVIMRLPFSTLASAISAAFASSFASLIDGKVPASQLPSYVDDVLEYSNIGTFPGTGEAGKIYVAIDTNKTYRWSGSAYVEISASLALGETSSTAYRGDRGKTAYDHSQATGNPHGTTKTDIGLSNVDNTSDVNKPVSTAQAAAIGAKANKTQENFTEPTFLNGWSNHSEWFQSAGYMKDEFGFVVLKGLVKDGTAANIFQLPAGYRPNKYTMFAVVAADAFGAIGIETDGNVYLRAGSNGFVSLDGIRFKP